MGSGNYYVKPKDFLYELEKFKDSGKISEELGKIFLDIATNLSRKGNFSGYTWKRDMIGEAVYTCMKYAHNFDVSKQKTPNPFGYFSKICYRRFVTYIKSQKKHSDIKDRCYNNVYVLSENDQYVEKAIDYESLK